MDYQNFVEKQPGTPYVIFEVIAALKVSNSLRVHL
jgi:hypothetical protein